jgi:hypothetical protein
MQEFLYKKNVNKQDCSFYFTSRFIDDVISLNTSRCGDFIDGIYRI